MAEPLTFQACLEDWLAHLALERRASPRTVEAYRACLTAFAAFLVDHLAAPASPQTTSTGRSTSCSRRTASESPYGKPAHAATRSHEAWVWNTPS